MARISQYKALGTGLGGYKSTLSKVQSMEYAKKHADWKAGEKKSLYKEIGGTVSNILGIAKEKHLLDEQKARQQKYDDKYLTLDKPDRPQVPGPEPYQEEMIGDIGVDPDAGADFDASAPIPGLESSYDIGMEGAQDIGEAPAEIDYSGAATAGQRGGQSRKITIKPEGAGALPIGTGVPFAEKGGMKGGEDMSAANAMVDQWIKEDADNPLFNKEKLARLEAQDIEGARSQRIKDTKERIGARESNEDLRLRAQRLGMTEEQVLQREAESRPAGEQVNIKSGKTYYADESGQRSASRLDDTPVEGYRELGNRENPFGEPLPLEPGPRPNIPANVDFINDMTESPVMGKVDMASPEMLGDEAVMDMISDPTLGDFDKGTLPSQSALERQLVSKMKDKGLNISTAQIDKLVSEFASVESKGQDIRQELEGEVGTGKGTGKGAGYFQFETGKGQGFETGLNRVENMYKKIGKKVPGWVKKAKDAGSPIGLSKKEQREILIANLYQQEGHSEKVAGGTDFNVMKKAFESGDFSELWAKRHWSGAKADTSEYQEKIKQYQRDKGRYKF